MTTQEQTLTGSHVHCSDCGRAFPTEQGAYMHAIRLGHNVGDFHFAGDLCQARAAREETYQ